MDFRGHMKALLLESTQLINTRRHIGLSNVFI